ncbi:MAG TPA: OmpW family outer membrane protein [Polyangiaceae bacterium]|nr:OmpW family outer membrane protein [Polyangiaceae bacterium]
MIRKLSSLAFGALIALSTATAFAQDEEPPAEGGGDDAAAAPAEGGDAAAPAEGGGGEAAAGGEAAMDTSNMDAGGKIKIGLRVGYGLPLGDASKDNKLGDSISGIIPIWVDLGYMVTPNIMVGLYGQYGIAMLNSDIKDACDAANADCSAAAIRFGLQGQYHLSPAESLDPWFGLGIGYEMLNFKSPIGDANTTGLEFLNLQAGANFKVADSIGVGPFVSFSLGQYSSVEGNDIPEKSMHQWLVLGVGGTLGI